MIALTGARDLRGHLPTRGVAAPYPLRSLKDVRWCVVHHTGDGSARPTAADVADYQTGPTAGYPFPAIAYHVYVEADGTIEMLHDLEAEVWANGVGSPSIDANGEGIYNEWTVAVCFSGQDPTTAQWSSVMRVWDTLPEVFVQPLQLTGHGLLPGGGTSCPGPVATSRLKAPIL